MKKTGITTAEEARQIVYLTDRKKELQDKAVKLRQELQEVNLKLNDIDERLWSLQNV